MKHPASARLARAVLAVVLIFAVWHAVILVFGLKPYVMPPPQAAIGVIVSQWGHLRALAWQTLVETADGYVLGAAIGFILGILMGQMRLVREVLYPILITSQAVPIVAIAAPLVIIFGFGLLPKLIIVAWIVFFPVVVSVLDGLAHVDADLANLARMMGAKPWRAFLVVRLPATISPLFSGLKIGATYAVTGAVIGEWTASSSVGLGTYLLSANARLNTAGVYGAMLLLTVIGVGSFLLVQGVELLLTPWRSRSTAPRWLRRRSAVAPAPAERLGSPKPDLHGGMR